MTADELAEYVHTQVREAHRQPPESHLREGQLRSQHAARLGSCGSTPAAPPAPKFGAFVIESNMDDVEVFVDGKSVGVAEKGKPISVPGLPPGEHTIKGVKMGYEPDGPAAGDGLPRPGVHRQHQDTDCPPPQQGRRSTRFDKGMEYYQKGNEQNYRKAAELFEKALEVDPTYSQAAFYLGLTYSALFDEDKRRQFLQEGHRNSTRIIWRRTPTMAACCSIPATWMRPFASSIPCSQREPANHAVALTLIAQAYRLKELYPQSIESARKAIKMNPKTAEPHLWLADSLRLSGKYRRSPSRL